MARAIREQSLSQKCMQGDGQCWEHMGCTGIRELDVKCLTWLYDEYNSFETWAQYFCISQYRLLWYVTNDTQSLVVSNKISFSYFLHVLCQSKGREVSVYCCLFVVCFQTRTQADRAIITWIIHSFHSCQSKQKRVWTITHWLLKLGSHWLLSRGSDIKNKQNKTKKTTKL